MSLPTNPSLTQVQSTSPSSPTPVKTPVPLTIPTTTSPTVTLKESAKVTVEVPTSSTIPFNPFDPTWVKLWEQVGPISYLGLLCVFIWLLTRLVETVKSK